MKTTARRLAAMGLAGMLATNTAMAADLLTGEWSGSYTCYQGLTALALVIEPDGEHWSGMFIFGPQKENKDVPFGAYEISITEDDGIYYVVPGEWVDRPEGYEAIGMRGGISADMTAFSGELDFDGCTTFETTRMTAMPAVDGKTK